MRHITLALALVAGIASAIAFASPAWACRTHTYIINGEVVTCTICPYTTTCF